MSSKFNTSTFGPTIYPWCKKHIIIIPPLVGDPYPPYLNAEGAYETISTGADHIAVMGSCKLVRFMGTLHWQGTINTLTSGEQHCLQVELRTDPAPPYWLASMFPYKGAWSDLSPYRHHMLWEDLFQGRLYCPPWDYTSPNCKTAWLQLTP
jgi:hypothetical protein